MVSTLVPGQGEHREAILRPAVADRADERRHHGPDGMDRPLLFHGLHLRDRRLPRVSASRPSSDALPKYAHIDAVVPGLGPVADRIAAALFLLPDVPAARAGHAHHGPGAAHHLADLFDGQHLAEMLGLRLVDHGGLDGGRELAFFPVDGLEPSEGLRTLR